MPITINDIREHYDSYGIHDLSRMTTTDYRQALENGAFFWIDHHDFVRGTFSEEILAINRDQLDAMIEYLLKFRDKMSSSS